MADTPCCKCGSPDSFKDGRGSCEDFSECAGRCKRGDFAGDDPRCMFCGMAAPWVPYESGLLHRSCGVGGVDDNYSCREVHGCRWRMYVARNIS